MLTVRKPYVKNAAYFPTAEHEQMFKPYGVTSEQLLVLVNSETNIYVLLKVQQWVDSVEELYIYIHNAIAVNEPQFAYI